MPPACAWGVSKATGLRWESGRGRRQPRQAGPLAPVALLGGRCLGDDAHAGAAATHAAATGGTEAAAAVAKATAVAASTRTEAATPAVACAPRGGDHGCGEKAQACWQAPWSPQTHPPGAHTGSLPSCFLRGQKSPQSPEPGLERVAQTHCPHHKLPQLEHLYRTCHF